MTLLMCGLQRLLGVHRSSWLVGCCTDSLGLQTDSQGDAARPRPVKFLPREAIAPLSPAGAATVAKNSPNQIVTAALRTPLSPDMTHSQLRLAADLYAHLMKRDRDEGGDGDGLPAG